MTQYFQVLRDYKSAQRPDIMHGYKAGQILVGYRNGGNVNLYGPTKSDKVFGEKPCSFSTSDEYNQTLSLEDVVEVLKVSHRQLKAGDQIVFDKTTPSNIGYSVNAGDVCYVVEVDQTEQPLLLSGQIHPTGLWFRARDLMEVGIYRLPHKEKEVDTEPQLEDTVETKSEGEVEETPKPRTKPIYEVQLKGVAVFRTPSRDNARKLKAKLGGKEKGAIIMQYNAVKEIR